MGDVRLGELQRFDPATGAWQRHLDGISADAGEYSRNGQWVVYVRYPDQSLWRCRADGTQCLQLADGRFGAYLPHWSPDNRTIAFQAQEPGKPWRIWLVNVDGSALRLGARSYPEDQCHAAWTSDGKRIIFGSGFGSRRLLPLSIETTSLQILDIESGQVTPMPGTDGLWSPNSAWDGSRLLALTLLESGRQPGLTILDAASGRWKKASEEIPLFPTSLGSGQQIRHLLQSHGDPTFPAGHLEFRSRRSLRPLPSDRRQLLEGVGWSGPWWRRSRYAQHRCPVGLRGGVRAKVAKNAFEPRRQAGARDTTSVRSCALVPPVGSGDRNRIGPPIEPPNRCPVTIC